VTRRDWLGSILALGAGLAIAVVDSRPGWDDTGITAGALVLAAALAAFVTGRRPWLVALLVGLPTPLLEVPRNGQPAAFAGLVFAAVGAVVGFLAARSIRSGHDPVNGS
jgi:hypothetical protein